MKQEARKRPPRLETLEDRSSPVSLLSAGFSLPMPAMDWRSGQTFDTLNDSPTRPNRGHGGGGNVLYCR